jgi:hypothetical protein
MVAILATFGVAGRADARLAPAAQSTSIARCASGGLRVHVLLLEGATSHRYWEMAFQNVGPASCRLQGYPGVGLLNARGRLIADKVERQPGEPTPSVTIAHGGRAYFTFGYVVAGPCIPRDFKAYGLEVYPPDDFTRLLVPTHGVLEVCDRSVGGAPLVYPIRAHAAL